MGIFAAALALPETFFDDKIDGHFSTCPSNHYPVIEDDPQPGQLRCGAHTDFGSLTILAFNDAPGGLQALMPDGSWLDVRPGPGQLAVNLGDMMQRWTNDRWKSTVHRVVNPPAARRDGKPTPDHRLFPAPELRCRDRLPGLLLRCRQPGEIPADHGGRPHAARKWNARIDG